MIFTTIDFYSSYYDVKPIRLVNELEIDTVSIKKIQMIDYCSNIDKLCYIALKPIKKEFQREFKVYSNKKELIVLPISISLPIIKKYIIDDIKRIISIDCNSITEILKKYEENINEIITDACKYTPILDRKKNRDHTQLLSGILYEFDINNISKKEIECVYEVIRIFHLVGNLLYYYLPIVKLPNELNKNDITRIYLEFTDVRSKIGNGERIINGLLGIRSYNVIDVQTIREGSTTYILKPIDGLYIYDFELYKFEGTNVEKKYLDKVYRKKMIDNNKLMLHIPVEDANIISDEPNNIIKLNLKVKRTSFPFIIIFFVILSTLLSTLPIWNLSDAINISIIPITLLIPLAIHVDRDHDNKGVKLFTLYWTLITLSLLLVNLSLLGVYDTSLYTVLSSIIQKTFLLINNIINDIYNLLISFINLVVKAISSIVKRHILEY